jgi:hypothetical protein
MPWAWSSLAQLASRPDNRERTIRRLLYAIAGGGDEARPPSPAAFFFSCGIKFRLQAAYEVLTEPQTVPNAVSQMDTCNSSGVRSVVDVGRLAVSDSPFTIDAALTVGQYVLQNDNKFYCG